MKSNTFELDGMFRFVERYERTAAKRPFPDLPALIASAESALSKQSTVRLHQQQAQVFIQTIDLEGGGYYHVCWTIDKALDVIRQNRLTPFVVPLVQAVRHIKPGAVDEGYLPRVAANRNPLIVVKYPQTNPPAILIDGNHRAVWRYRQGEQLTPAYVLEPRHHLEAMPSELFRVLFKIHHNMHEVFNYMGGYISAPRLLSY